MHDLFRSTLQHRAACAALSVLLVLPALSAAAQTVRIVELKHMPAVKIHCKTNQGDPPYETFFDMQSYLQSLMPSGERVLDLRLRVNFDSLKSPAYDLFEPKNGRLPL